MFTDADVTAPLRKKGKGGFALFVAIVMVVVLAVLATAVVSSLAGGNDAERVRIVADVLKRFEVEMINGATPSFKINMGVNPGALSQLGRRPVAGTDRNSCGTLYVAADVATTKWIGPYHLVPLQFSIGHQIARGFVAQDVLVRNPTGTSTVGTLAIVMPSVSRGDAQLLGRAVDGRVDGLGPYVRFSLSNDPTSVSYLVPISGC